MSHPFITDGVLTRRAAAATCPVCQATPGKACVIDPDARPFPSVMRIGEASPFHADRSEAEGAVPTVPTSVYQGLLDARAADARKLRSAEAALEFYGSRESWAVRDGTNPAQRDRGAVARSTLQATAYEPPPPWAGEATEKTWPVIWRGGLKIIRTTTTFTGGRITEEVHIGWRGRAVYFGWGPRGTSA